MSDVTYNGKPLGELTEPAPTDPNVVLDGDRTLLELLRNRRFAEAKANFPASYNNPHLAYLCGLTTGRSAPIDDQGPLTPLEEAEFLAAIDYLEGPTKH